jgi:hypothetical protein
MSARTARLPAPAVILVVGFVVAFGAYFMTATRPAAAGVSPCSACPPFFSEAFPGLTVYPPIYITSWTEPHFDPLSGEPRGWSYATPNRISSGETTTVGPVPADMVGRWAVPLPLGAIIGGLAGYALLIVARRRVQARERVARQPGRDTG